MIQKSADPETRPYVEVAVSLPVWKTFTYRVPPKLSNELALGKRVLIPFRRRKVTGYALSFHGDAPDDLDPAQMRDVLDVLDETPVFDAAMLSLFRWMADYYIYPLGEAIKTGLPPGLNVETYRIMKITPYGEDRLAELPHGSSDHRILLMCAKEREVSLDSLSRRLKLDNLRARVFSLKQRRLLAEELRLKKERTRVKREAFVTPQEGRDRVGESRLSKKEAEVLAFIRLQRRVSRRKLRSQFSGGSSYLTRLQKKGWVTVDFEEVYRDPFGSERGESDTVPELTPDQQKALFQIEESMSTEGFHPYLLHGITGSGKTEIYLQAIQRAVEKNRQAIVLVPEISLTPQLISRFRSRFTRGIALLHSGLSPGERYDQWRQILRGEVSIAIGARSAIFAPFKRLGIIIVDEEHETSFKQEEKLKYNARDLAVVRARMAGAVLVLGSATPSIESFHNTAQTQKFHYLRLPQRVESRPLPEVQIVDMRSEQGEGNPVFSTPLKDALLANIEFGHQSLLFLNRRGFANFVLCRECGWTFQCPNCSVTLTYHAAGRILQCHHCGLTMGTPLECPQCHGYDLRPLGIGTQRVEDEILALIPTARIARMDRDTTGRKGAYSRIVRAMESGKIDVLIGTQMIVKGHDFPNITLVGIISADTILNFPDFRSTERTFQLLTQAAGRAGRGTRPGRVIIQTYNPNHYGIQRAKGHDFLGFYEEEIVHREELGYPPFSRLANLRFSGNREDTTAEFARRMASAGHRIQEKRQLYRKHIDVLGPCSAPLAKVKGRHRWHMLLKSDNSEMLHRFIGKLIKRMEKEATGVYLEIDMDPINLM